MRGKEEKVEVLPSTETALSEAGEEVETRPNTEWSKISNRKKEVVVLPGQENPLSAVADEVHEKYEVNGEELVDKEEVCPDPYDGPNETSQVTSGKSNDDVSSRVSDKTEVEEDYEEYEEEEDEEEYEEDASESEGGSPRADDDDSSSSAGSSGFGSSYASSTSTVLVLPPRTPHHHQQQAVNIAVHSKTYQRSAFVPNDGLHLAEKKLRGNPKAVFEFCEILRPHNILECKSLHLTSRAILIGNAYVRLNMLLESEEKLNLLRNPGKALGMTLCFLSDDEHLPTAGHSSCPHLHLRPHIRFVGSEFLRVAYYEEELVDSLGLKKLLSDPLGSSCGAWCRSQRSHVVPTCRYIHYRRSAGEVYTEKPKPPAPPQALIPGMNPRTMPADTGRGRGGRGGRGRGRGNSRGGRGGSRGGGRGNNTRGGRGSNRGPGVHVPAHIRSSMQSTGRGAGATAASHLTSGTAKKDSTTTVSTTTTSRSNAASGVAVAKGSSTSQKKYSSASDVQQERQPVTNRMLLYAWFLLVTLLTVLVSWLVVRGGRK